MPDYPPELEAIVMKALRSIRTAVPGRRRRRAALERLAADLGMPLGHGAITGPMKQLFSERRRRFARSSRREASTADPTSPTFTPVTPIDDADAADAVDPVRALAPVPDYRCTTMRRARIVLAAIREHDETTEPREITIDLAAAAGGPLPRAEPAALGEAAAAAADAGAAPLDACVRYPAVAVLGHRRWCAARRAAVRGVLLDRVGVFVLAVIAAILR